MSYALVAHAFGGGRRLGPSVASMGRLCAATPLPFSIVIDTRVAVSRHDGPGVLSQAQVCQGPEGSDKRLTNAPAPAGAPAT